MKISSILDIVRGKFQNKPKISFVTQMHSLLKKVKEGDLFISNDLIQIKSAINKGAFCIISELDLTNLDDEIALIKVNSIKEAAIRLMRFFLIDKPNIEVYLIDRISYKLCLPYNKKNVILLNEPISDFEVVMNLDYDEEYYIDLAHFDKNYIEKISPEYYTLEVIDREINFINHSLFEVSFLYKSRFYSKIKLPSIYINHFVNIIEFLGLEEYDVNKLESCEIFRTIFINKNYEIVPFGSTNRFIILATKDFEEIEIDYIEQNFSYGKIKVLKECNYLEKFDFNCLYVKNCDYNLLEEKLKESQIKQLTLF